MVGESRSRARADAVSTAESESKSTSTTRAVGERVTCPECGGTLVHDAEHGETVCERCGLVVDEAEIDHGPEWRAFDSNERDEKARVGAPTTNLLHDKGLSTTIGWQDRDAYGNALSSRQRRQMQRLRTWDERYRTKDHKERALKHALGEIERMGSALGLPRTVRETASVIYRRALDDGLLPGRSIEGVATSAVYAAARQANLPRTIRDVAAVSRVDEPEFTRTYRYVVRELSLQIAPPDPENYLGKYASELGASDELVERAHELLRDAKEEGLHSGKNPVGLAAAALYAAGLLTNEQYTQERVSAVTGMSEVTIRNRYRELLELADRRTAVAA